MKGVGKRLIGIFEHKQGEHCELSDNEGKLEYNDMVREKRAVEVIYYS